MNVRRCVLLLIAVLLVWPWRVAAHAGGAPVLTDAPAGPYRVYAWMQPEPLYAGEVHLSVALVRSSPDATQADALDEPVTDAQVVARFEALSDATQVIVAPLEPLQGLGGFYYEADVVLALADRWRISLEIDGEDGHGALSFERQVLPARRVNWQLVIGAAVALIFFMGLMGSWKRLQTGG